MLRIKVILLNSENWSVRESIFGQIFKIDLFLEVLFIEE